MVSHPSPPLLQRTICDLDLSANIAGSSFHAGISLGCLVEKGLCQGASGRGYFCRTPCPYSRTLPSIRDCKSEISPLSGTVMHDVLPLQPGGRSRGDLVEWKRRLV